MEWELALREAMEQLQFRVINRENAFQLLTAPVTGCILARIAVPRQERVLLKILFR